LGNQEALARRKSMALISTLLVLAVLCSSLAMVLGASVPDTVSSSSRTGESPAFSSAIVSESGLKPVAEAGPDQNVTVKTTVSLDGSASIPSDNAVIENYTWSVRYQVTTTYYYGRQISFFVNDTGLYVANLTVRDSNNLTAWDITYVLVKTPAKGFFERYWLQLIVVVAVLVVVGYYAAVAIGRVLSGQPLLSEATSEKISLSIKKFWKTTHQLVRNPMGLIGLCILVFFIMMAILWPTIAPYKVDLASTDLKHDMELPSKDHWLGRDNFGIDILSELLYGAQTSMLVGVVSAIIASFLGALVGLYSGYVGGWKDEAVMRVNDVILSIPWLVLMIIVAAFLGSIDLTGIILIIGLTGWSTTARMVRAQVLSVRERQFVERARAIGGSDLSILRRHIFPNTFPLVFANTILTVAVSILSEATLSFLGLRPAGVVTWGTMLSFASDSSAFEAGLHWWILAPGLCIVAVVLGFTLLGYALDEILNPKLRHR